MVKTPSINPVQFQCLLSQVHQKEIYMNANSVSCHTYLQLILIPIPSRNLKKGGFYFLHKQKISISIKYCCFHHLYIKSEHILLLVVKEGKNSSSLQAFLFAVCSMISTNM